jgi:hypothetical protein
MKYKKSKGLNIVLVNGWKIKSDTYNIILERSDGKQYFYFDVQSAVEGLVQKEIKNFDSTTIQELIFAVKTLSNSLSEALEPLNLVCVPVSEVQEKLI